MVKLRCPEQDIKLHFIAYGDDMCAITLNYEADSTAREHKSSGAHIGNQVALSVIGLIFLLIVFRISKTKNKGAKQIRAAISQAIVPATRVVAVAVPKKTKNRKKNKTRSMKRMHPYALSKVNPFLAAINGVRAPDEFGYPTGTGVVRNAYSMSTNSGSFASNAFLPMVFGTLYGPANVTGGTVAWAGGGWTAASQASAFGNLASVYRSVSWGLRVTCESSLTNAAGHLWVAHVPLNMSATVPYFDWPTTEAQFAALPLSEKFSLVELAERPLIVPGRAFDDGIYRFRSTGSIEYTVTGVGLESSVGWCAIVIFVVGAAASALVLNVEHINHVEFIHAGSTLYGFVDTIPGAYDPSAIVEASQVADAAPVGLLENTVSTVEAAVGVAERLVVAGSSLIGSMGSAYRAAGAIRQMTGFLRGPANSPFAQIEYKQELSLIHI